MHNVCASLLPGRAMLCHLHWIAAVHRVVESVESLYRVVHVLMHLDGVVVAGLLSACSYLVTAYAAKHTGTCQHTHTAGSPDL
jgi:hypothetical protein